MDQEQIRDQLRRRRELFVFEGDLNKGHREEGSHTHLSISAREVFVTKFTRDIKGKLTEVRTTLGRER